MIDHIVDISDIPAHLSVRNGLLVIVVDGSEIARVPLAEVRVLVVSNRRAMFTNAVISRLMEAGGMFVACDERHRPAGMVLPLRGHGTQGERFAIQAQVSDPVKKRVWQVIVRAKIQGQARVLGRITGDDCGLGAMAASVRSGDPDNLEARAAQKYWPRVFRDNTFRRDPDGGGINSLLNYGYGVVRATVARSICSAGLHPSLGVHHHNRYDSFCLASDLMEPYRPLVDGVVIALRGLHGADIELDKTVKRDLLSALTGRFIIGGEARTLFSLCAETAQSLYKVYSGKAKKVFVPVVDHAWEKTD